MGERFGALLFVVAAISAGACDRGGAERPAGGHRRSAIAQPVVHRLDRLTLTENDTAYVGRPAALSVDRDDGSLYVTDEFWGRVLRFSPGARLVRMYGRRGEGPGELKSPGTVEVVDGAVVVLDVNRITRYGRDDGKYLGGARFAGSLTSIHPLGGRLWLGGLNLGRKASLGTWAPGEPTVRPVGTIPAEFTQSEPLGGVFTGGEGAAWGDTGLAGHEGPKPPTPFPGGGAAV